MATITEDYVSFETAKLLKEKGMDESCFKHYVQKNNNNGTSEAVTVCTLQIAMKWLRESHNIMVSPYALSLGYYFEIFDLTNRDITGCKPLYQVGIPNKKAVLNTCEEACEAAIKYCLENSI